MPRTLVVFSSDENYFALARGLALSLLACQPEQHDIGLAFIDTGCRDVSLNWLCDRGITVTALDQGLLQHFPRATGYRQSLVCRPFLPRIFPEADAIIWLDSDLWVQTVDVLANLRALALAHRNKLFICPEWHYSYLGLNQNFAQHHIANLSFYYEATYGPQVAAEMSVRPMFNNGVFAMAADNPLWDAWRREIELLYARNYGQAEDRILHMSEQIALNVLAHRTSSAIPVDPLYNYMCMWGMPFRDPSGVVRVSLPPGSVIGAVHLSQWNLRKQLYLDRRLLYQGGDYLTAEEREFMLSG